jgi:hypothetical protein
MRNYYKVLGISENASPKEIKKAYYKLIKQWHPDHNPHTPISDDMMKMYNEAYEVLSNPEEKSNYDISIGKRSNHTDSEQSDHTGHEGYEYESHRKITITDRFLTAFFLMVASFLTGLCIWFPLFLFGVRGHYLIPFSPVIYFSVFFTFVGFISPNKSIDMIGYIWDKIHIFFKAIFTYR